MARRELPKRSGKQPTDLVPRLKAAVEVVDEALDRLADPAKARRAARPRSKRVPR